MSDNADRMPALEAYVLMLEARVVTLEQRLERLLTACGFVILNDGNIARAADQFAHWSGHLGPADHVDHSER
jgi:hypothetical protein